MCVCPQKRNGGIKRKIEGGEGERARSTGTVLLDDLHFFFFRFHYLHYLVQILHMTKPYLVCIQETNGSQRFTIQFHSNYDAFLLERKVC